MKIQQFGFCQIRRNRLWGPKMFIGVLGVNGCTYQYQLISESKIGRYWYDMYLHYLMSLMFRQDGNGYIDEQELDALLRDLYQKNKKVRWLKNLQIWMILVSHPLTSAVTSLGGGPEEPDGLQAEHHEPLRRWEALPRRAGDRPLQGANRLTPSYILPLALSLSLHNFVYSAWVRCPETTPTSSCLAVFTRCMCLTLPACLPSFLHHFSPN